MWNRTFVFGVAACTLLTLGHIASAQTPPSSSSGGQVTVPFSDPSRPGTVKVNVLSGSISVKVGSGRDVVVNTSDARDQDSDRDRERERERERSRNRNSADDPAAGLRRLSQPSGVNIEEENNIVSIVSPAMMGRASVSIEVPAATSLVLRALNGGAVTVTGVTGSIEVNNVNGAITLTDVGGPVIAHATNGKVVARLRQLPAGKPMSFTSFNGDVDVTLPASAKASLKMRSDRGDVYTDFDVQTTQAPRTQGASGDARRGDTRPRDNRDDRPSGDAKGKPKYQLEMDRSVYGNVNGGGPDFELRTFNGDIYLRKAK